MKHNQMKEQDDLREYRFLRRRFLKDPLEKFIPRHCKRSEAISFRRTRLPRR